MDPARERSRRRNGALALGLQLLLAAPLAAVPPITLKTEALFYGDNSELFNPYRTGETIFGADARVFFSVRLGPKVEIRAGVFGNERFGSESSFELVRPVLGLMVGTEKGRFLIGTLETVRRAEGPGPDRTTLHGLVPPLQAETLSFTRPHESGVQWILDGESVKNDLWLNWQKLNTPEHREVLDAGTAGRVRLKGPFSLAAQLHVVHHGGQLYGIGPVSDSFGYGPGLVAEPAVPCLDRFSAELYGFFSKDKRDRSRPDLTTSGRAVFLRVSGEKDGWRGHLIVFAGHDFVKEEGDANYLSRSSDGTFFRSDRNYAELGAARVFRPAAGVELEASARLHRIDTALEYSYRLIGTVRFDVPLVNPK